MTPWFTVGDVAYLTGLSKPTVRRAVASGNLAAAFTPGGHHRFTPAAVSAFVRKLGMVA